MKKVMSGRKFSTILRYLHCCPVDNRDPSADNYNPSYKVAEQRIYLHQRYERLFVPGQQLSLDETLLRAFGGIKFKVRIVSKSARYGITVYVLTDARTAFILRVVVYTGKSTYDREKEMDKKKTVQIVERLVNPYKDSHRTIYVDRFYTSIELLKSLAERKLYLTGIMMANRIPQGIRIAKTSATFRQMKRGDAVKSKFLFKVGDENMEAGLVSWKDRSMVYCLSNDSNNFEFDKCTHRSANGLVKIPRPVFHCQLQRIHGWSRLGGYAPFALQLYDHGPKSAVAETVFLSR
jgi:Transposase IS4